eukprot:TRINITY_DN27760_c0_g1_i3.p1 TRINITY_DN27760_c0_g1~~TRINITY_DN27760_c0_g1_i3.p1  ORF type:complete len:323 (-),score=54.02 TRINITY_DN27760_c0_g1_i3:153-1121(-)
MSEAEPLVPLSRCAVFGDSWALPDYAWPIIFARMHGWKIWQFAQGGSTSESLKRQAEHAHTTELKDDPSSVLAIIHSGGNDLQVSLASGPCGFIKTSVCACTLWHPCYLAALGTLVLFGWLTGCWMTAGVFATLYVCGQMYTHYQISWERNQQYVVEQVARNILETMESVHALGITQMIVSGLPVSPAVPMLAQIAHAVPCHTGFMMNLARLFAAFSSSRIQGKIASFRRKNPNCKVVFFDEAAELHRLMSKGPEVNPGGPDAGPRRPAMSDFWIDPIHPSLNGHMWLAHQVRALWDAEHTGATQSECEEQVLKHNDPLHNL